MTGLPLVLSTEFIQASDTNVQFISTFDPQYRLVVPGRQMIRSGTLGKVCRKGCSPRVVLLVSDGLLFARANENPSGTRQSAYQFRTWWPLHTLRVMSLPEPLAFENNSHEIQRCQDLAAKLPLETDQPYLGIPYSFLILSQEKSVQVYCDTL